MTFRSRTLEEISSYVPPDPDPDPRDDERASRVYLALHRIVSTRTAMVLHDETGEIIPDVSWPREDDEDSPDVPLNERHVLVDVQSAAMSIAVADALRPENRAKLLAMPITRLVYTAVAVCTRSTTKATKD